jgi:hypothetical protein
MFYGASALVPFADCPFARLLYDYAHLCWINVHGVRPFLSPPPSPLPGPGARVHLNHLDVWSRLLALAK